MPPALLGPVVAVALHAVGPPTPDGTEHLWGAVAYQVVAAILIVVPSHVGLQVPCLDIAYQVLDGTVL